MLIKYCNKCAGHPYTEDFSITQCPVCKSNLDMEFIEPESISGRPKLPIMQKKPTFTETESPNTTFSNLGSNSNHTFSNATTYQPKNQSNNSLPSTNSSKNSVSVMNNNASNVTINNKKKRTGITSVTGKVSQYSSSGKEDGTYRRLFIHKLIDAIFYRQRFEDILHRFILRIDNGKDAMGYSQYVDIPVNVHGTIAGGMQITDNSEVEVEGKYKNGVLMASKVCVINTGYQSKIKFQHSVTAIIYSILLLMAAIVMVVYSANSSGNFLESIKSFSITWLIVFVLLSVLYLLMMLTKIGLLIRLTSKKQMKFPFVGTLLFSFIITMVIVNLFGF